MLRKVVLQQIADQRCSQKSLISHQKLVFLYGRQFYQNLIVWTFEIILPYSFLIFHIFQKCDQFKLLPATRFLFRVYLDFTLNSQIKTKVSGFKIIALVCLAMAIKLIENQETRLQFCRQRLLQDFDLQIQGKDYLSIQLHVIMILKNSLLFTTPFEHFSSFYARFPYFQNAEKGISDVLLLSIAIPTACEYSSQQIFYATVWSVLVYKKAKLTVFQWNLLNSLTHCWERAKIFSQEILKVIDKE